MYYILKENEVYFVISDVLRYSRIPCRTLKPEAIGNLFIAYKVRFYSHCLTILKVSYSFGFQPSVPYKFCLQYGLINYFGEKAVRKYQIGVLIQLKCLIDFAKESAKKEVL